MSESLLKQEEIAQYLADLIADVRDLKRQLKTLDRTEELGVSEEPQDIGGGIPFTQGDHLVPICRVVTLIDDTTFGALRQIPEDSVAGWGDDPELTNVLEVKISSAVPLPTLEDLVGPRFTGTYQVFTGGTTITLPRYGLFGGGGGNSQLIVKTVFGDFLRCRTFINSVEGPTDIDVAKPFKFRQTPFDGKTVGGISYGSYVVALQTRSALATGVSTRTQQITPLYTPDFDLIYATKVPNTQTFVASIELKLIDMNSDGRGWVTF